MRVIGSVNVMEDASGDIYIDEDAILSVQGDDESGDDDMGDDESGDDESGATRKRRRRLVRRAPKHRSEQIVRGSTRKSQGVKQMRVKSGLLGLSYTTVLAGATGTLDAVAQEPLYLQRLLLDGEPQFFALTDIKVGSKSIFSGVESVPAGMFRPDATGAPFSFKHRMRVGQTVTVELLNIDGATHSLQGSFKTIEQA